jgi:pimeloyl-ACP methyl ester carboxylesterase
MESRYAQYEGGDIFYTISGKGHVIVLVHGYLESSEVWGRFRDKLSDNFRVICVDLPGNGKSSYYSREFTMCFHSGAVMAVVKNENIDRFFLAGHSLGGYVALSTVENYPECLMGYILIHSHPFADSREVIDNRLREIKVVEAGKQDAIYPVNVPKMFADENLLKHADDIKELIRIAGEHSAEGIVAVLRGMIKRKSREHILSAGRVPLLYILGVKDNYIPYKLMIEKLKMPEEAVSVSLHNSGHMGFLEETDLMISAISDFILKCI